MEIDCARVNIHGERRLHTYESHVRDRCSFTRTMHLLCRGRNICTAHVCVFQKKKCFVVFVISCTLVY